MSTYYGEEGIIRDFSLEYNKYINIILSLEDTINTIENRISKNREILNNPEEKSEEEVEKAVEVSQEALNDAYVILIGKKYRDSNRLSLEHLETNIEKLRYSTEGLKDFLGSLYESFKITFTKFGNFFKKWGVKMTSFYVYRIARLENAKKMILEKFEGFDEKASYILSERTFRSYPAFAIVLTLDSISNIINDKIGKILDANEKITNKLTGDVFDILNSINVEKEGGGHEIEVSINKEISELGSLMSGGYMKKLLDLINFEFKNPNETPLYSFINTPKIFTAISTSGDFASTAIARDDIEEKYIKILAKSYEKIDKPRMVKMCDDSIKLCKNFKSNLNNFEKKINDAIKDLNKLKSLSLKSSLDSETSKDIKSGYSKKYKILSKSLNLYMSSYKVALLYMQFMVSSAISNKFLTTKGSEEEKKIDSDSADALNRGFRKAK